MRMHPSDLDIQHYGLGTLRNLAVDADNQVALAASGGKELVQQSMRTHPSVLTIQRYGLSFLGNLTENADNKVALAGSGGVLRCRPMGLTDVRLLAH